MAAATTPERTTPAWYRRLPPALQRVAAASDRVPVVPLRAGPELRDAVTELPGALAGGECPSVQTASQRIADGVCRALGVSRVRIRSAASVRATRAASCTASTSAGERPPAATRSPCGC